MLKGAGSILFTRNAMPASALSIMFAYFGHMIDCTIILKVRGILTASITHVKVAIQLGVLRRSGLLLGWHNVGASSVRIAGLRRNCVSLKV